MAAVANPSLLDPSGNLAVMPDLRGFSAVVKFPELPARYRRVETRYVQAESLKSAVTRAAHAAFQQVKIRSRRPRRIVVIIEALEADA